MKNITTIVVCMVVIASICLIWKTMDNSAKREKETRQDRDELCACKTELAKQKTLFTVSEN